MREEIWQTDIFALFWRESWNREEKSPKLLWDFDMLFSKWLLDFEFKYGIDGKENGFVEGIYNKDCS